jgi:hypothetical protein
MSKLSECLGWTGRRVWVRESPNRTPLIGTIVHASPTPLHRGLIDLTVRLKSDGFTVVSSDERGVQWVFEGEGWSERVA